MDELHCLTSAAGCVIQGSTDLTKDKRGLALAEKLLAELQAALAHHPAKPSKDAAPAKLKLEPFQNESDAVSIGALNIENRMDRVSVYGKLHISNAAAGYLAGAELSELVSGIVSALKADATLPDAIATVVIEMVENPFFQGG